MLKKLERLILQMESKISAHAVMQPAISNASVGWHIEHALLTIDAITNSLAKSKPEDYRYQFDMNRTMVLLLGKIPRGRARAPKVVIPSTDFNETTLRQHVHLTLEKIKTLDQLTAKHFFKHPFLGDFKLKSAQKFIIVHTQHHLAIINDIIKTR